MPLTLRIIFYSVRSVMLGITIMVVGWVSLTPASSQESTALQAAADEARPEGLVEMRIAQAFMHFAPERAANMISKSSDGAISPKMAAEILDQIAQGTALQTPPAEAVQASEVVAEVAPEISQTRSISGAKFVSSK